jgi:hypothetical protein
LNNGLDGSDFEVVNALLMGSRFPVSGARGFGHWLAVLLGFFLALASTVEAIPTRGAAGYLESEPSRATSIPWWMPMAGRLRSRRRSIQRRATLQFEFGLPSPPWMS